MGLAELQQMQERAIGQLASEMHPGGVVLPLDFSKEHILPFPLWTDSAVADATLSSNDNYSGLGAATLQLGNGADKCVTAAVGLNRAIHKGDDRLSAAQFGAIG